MLEVIRYPQPTPEQLEEAAALSHLHWDYLRALDGPERRKAFQSLGVELAVAVDDGQIQAAAFLLPAPPDLNPPAGPAAATFYFLFQVCARPGAKGAGAVLISSVMRWYPAILGVGITAQAERVYVKLRWQPLDSVWRGVHPINLAAMLADYGDRFEKPWMRTTLGLISGLYNLLSPMAEFLLALGKVASPSLPLPGNPREQAIAAYIGLLESGAVRAADVGGIGRIVAAPPSMGSLVHHAAVWRGLRRRGAKFCEIMLMSSDSRSRAILGGYIPMRLQFMYWDKHKTLGEPELARLRRISFVDTDKVV